MSHHNHHPIQGEHIPAEQLEPPHSKRIHEQVREGAKTNWTKEAYWICGPGREPERHDNPITAIWAIFLQHMGYRYIYENGPPDRDGNLGTKRIFTCNSHSVHRLRPTATIREAPNARKWHGTSRAQRVHALLDGNVTTTDIDRAQLNAAMNAYEKHHGKRPNHWTGTSNRELSDYTDHYQTICDNDRIIQAFGIPVVTRNRKTMYHLRCGTDWGLAYKTCRNCKATLITNGIVCGECDRETLDDTSEQIQEASELVMDAWKNGLEQHTSHNWN